MPPKKDVPTGQQKSRIPQRLSPARPRFQLRTKVNTNHEVKNKTETPLHTRFSTKNTIRPRSGDQARPKSANQVKEELNQALHSQPVMRTTRYADEKQKKVTPASRRNINDRQKEVTPISRPTRPIITVPVKQKQASRTPYTARTSSILPDQDTIKRCEEMEAHDFGYAYNMPDSTDTYTENDEDSITTRSEKVVHLQLSWQEKIAQFEKMKRELNDRQNTILQMYASLCGTQQQLAQFGQETCLPTTEDLKVMNVAKMTPAQLLQLCEETARKKEDNEALAKQNIIIPIDMNKLNNIPIKIVSTCEQILNHQTDLTAWFKGLITQEKRECSVSLLTKKLKEFNAENEMLNGLLHTSQNEFLKESSNMVEFLRKCIKDSMPLQIRNEELTYEISELNSKIIDLRKQLHTAEQLKSQNHKAKIEELERELKDEKSKQISMRDRIKRTSVEVKMEIEKSENLEADLTQARSHSKNLERTILQLQDQNNRLQADFDTELNKLNESIKENTVHLEEIADAREKLQSEKEDLEKRLEELSTHYSESLKNLKHELNTKVTELIEAEKKYNLEIEEKKRLQEIVEAQCAQLIEAECRYKDMSKKLLEFEELISKSGESERKLGAAEEELHMVKEEIEQYKHRLMGQVDTMKEIEQKFKESRTLEDKLKSDLQIKDEYISSLKNKQIHMEKQLQESDSKMALYEEQLISLKTHILQLQECFGEYENINDLREMLNQQKSKVQEIAHKNSQLNEQLQKRNLEFNVQIETVAKQEHDLKQKDNIIKTLSQKEEEQARIIKLLRNNLEITTQKDTDLNNQLLEKNEEIDVLINSLETRKGQISQLEKIILTLEDQLRKVSQQKRKDDDKIDILEQKIEEYKTFIENRSHVEPPTKNLESLFVILEDELGKSFNEQFKDRDNSKSQKSKYSNNRNEHQKRQEFVPKQNIFETDDEKTYTNDVGDFVKNIPNFSKDNNNYKRENSSRKKNVHMDTARWAARGDRFMVSSTPTKETNSFQTPREPNASVGHSRDKYISRNLPLLVPDPFRDDKQYKMLKLASHRL